MNRLGFGILVTAAIVMAVDTTGIAQAPRESIVVHGHWTLEVMNRDGSVADRREFENALQPDGSTKLADLLSRRRTVSGWIIGVSSAEPMFGTSASARVVEGAGTDSVTTFYNLSVGVDPTGKKTVLIGKLTPTQVGDVRFVSTSLLTDCAVNSCAPAPGPFTSTEVKNNLGVPTPLHLEVDQTLRVTVTIGFSSPAGS